MPVEEVFSDAAELAQERSGQRLEWPEVSAETAAVGEEVDELLARPLDAEAAVQVALLNNRRLHARYADLGSAAAAKVQAGLPPNPFLEVVARFRDGAGGTPQLEISVVEELLDLFLLPARKRLAAVELERAKLDLAGAVVDLAAATRSDFVRYQAEGQLLELDRQALLAVEAAWEMARQLREAGNISELDLLVERDYRPVFVPDGATLPYRVVDGVKVFHLVAEPIVHELAEGLTVSAWGYNGRTPGPVIEAVAGDRVRIYVTNRLPSPTSVHWHGMLVPNGMDGVAGLTQPDIPVGGTFRYEFVLPQPATFLYHPHFEEMTEGAPG